jgi:ribose transport system permease protein
MGDKLTGLIKIVGITVLLFGLWGFLAWYVPDAFLQSNNIENLLRRTALYGILGIGVAFVIIGSGIDLSIGSLVCLAACLLGLFLQVSYGPVETCQITAIDASQSLITIKSDNEFDIGDTFWFEFDRRNRGLGTVESVSPDGLEVYGSLGRKLPETDGKPQGKVSRAFPVLEFTDREIVFPPDFPALRAMDKIMFVSPTTTRERIVEREIEPGKFLLKETAAGIDSSFRAVPIRRKPRMSIPIAILSVIGISLVIGFIHGFLVSVINLQPFVVTLCGLMIYRAVARWLTGDQTVGFAEHSETIGRLGTGRWELWSAAEASQSFGIPYTCFIFAAFVVLAMVLLNLTVWGRHLQAVGRNQEAARYSGINTKRITLTTYLICSGLAGIGGMMHAIDSASIAPSAFGNFYELYAIAAAVLGGCSLRGGEGSILGVVVGTALMQTLYNATILLKIPNELEFCIIGAVILVGVIVDELIHRTSAAMKATR